LGSAEGKTARIHAIKFATCGSSTKRTALGPASKVYAAFEGGGGKSRGNAERKGFLAHRNNVKKLNQEMVKARRA
jgi:hypothetical protein